MGSVIEVHIVQKFLTFWELKSQFHLQMIQYGHLMCWYPEEWVDSWTNCISQMSHIIAPTRDYSLNMQTQKKAKLRLAHSKTSSRKLVAASVARHPRTKKLVTDSISVSSSPMYLNTKKNHSYDGKEMENNSCQFIVRKRISFNSDVQYGCKMGALSWWRRTKIWCSN